MSALGFLAPLVIYAVITALHVVLPAREVDGYVINPETARPYRYRLNGLVVYALTVALWAGLCATGVVSWTSSGRRAGRVSPERA